MMFRLAFVAAIETFVLASCFHPKFNPTLACGPDGECPPGQTCGADRMCHAGGAGMDAGSAPDAPPVRCQGDDECRQPPDACSTAGTCNLDTHTCSFGQIDCSSANDDCNDGVCDVHAGGCIKRPARQGAMCGPGNICGQFGACSGFSGACDSTGVQSRGCTQNTCQAGVCTSGEYIDTQACSPRGAVCRTDAQRSCRTTNAGLGRSASIRRSS